MNNSVKIYDLNRTDALFRSFDNDFKGNVSAVGFWKDDKWIYTACEDASLKIFDLRSKIVIKTMKQNRPITCAIIHPN